MTHQSCFLSFAMTVALLSSPVQAQVATKKVDSPTWQKCGSCCKTPILSKLPILNVLFKVKKTVTKQETPISKGKDLKCETKCGCAKKCCHQDQAKCACCKDACKCCQCGKKVKSCRCEGHVGAPVQVIHKHFTIKFHPLNAVRPVFRPNPRIIHPVPVMAHPQPGCQVVFPAPVHPWFVTPPAPVHMVPPTAVLHHRLPRPTPPFCPPMPVAAPCCPMSVKTSLCCNGAGKFFSILTDFLDVCANIYTLRNMPVCPFERQFAALHGVANPEGGNELEESSPSISSKVAQVQISDCGKLNIKVTENGVLITGRGVKCRAKKMTVDEHGSMRLAGQVEIQCEKQSCEMSFYADQARFQLKGSDLKVEMRDVKFVK